MASHASATETSTKPPSNGHASTSAPVLGEQGVSGTGNYNGRLLAESNAKLQHTQAFGTAGTQTWGEWERAARTNPFVHAGVEFVLAAIRDARLDFEADEANPASEAQVEFLHWTLDNCKPGRAEFLNQSGRGALTFGFALHEMVAEPVAHASLPGGRGYTVVKLAERLPSSVREDGWREDDAGNLATIIQLGPKKMGREFPTVELPASKCLLHSWNRNGNNYAGFSAFRPVWYLVKQQEEIIKILGVGMARESCGIPTVEGEKDAPDLTTEQRGSLEDFCSNATYHENANIIMPRGYSLKWIFSPGANKAHVVEAYQALGRIILAQVGAQQIELGTGSTGSRSVGEVHQSSAEAFIQGVCSSLERVLEKLVRTVIDWNWGPQASYPRPKLTLKKAKLGPKERFEAMKLAKDAGLLTITAADESAAREELGLSPIDEAERDEGREAEKESAAARAEMVPSPAAPEVGKGPPAAAALSRLSAGESLGFVPRRQLRASEQYLELAAINATFDRSRETFADGMRPLVAELLMRALPDVKAAMADGDATDVGEVPLDMTRVEAFVGKFLASLRAEGYRQAKGEMRRAGVKAGVQLAAGEEDDKYGPHETPDADAPDDLAPMRKHLTRRIKNRISSDMEREAIAVLDRGGDPEEVVSGTLEDQTSTGAFKTDAGIVTTRAFSMGREQFAEEFGDQIESCELSAILDKDTCGPCDQLDGVEFEFGSAEDAELTPPLSSKCNGGDACRCLKLFHIKRSRE